MNATVQNETCAANQCARDERESFVAPDVTIYETKDGYALEAEIPGVSKEGVELTLVDRELTVIARRTPEEVAGEPLLRERDLTNYRRVFELDPRVDTSRISARVERGVLFLSLPKAEEVKPRKIAVTA